MSDPWINRLLVAGPSQDVKRFSKAAIGSRPPRSWLPSEKKPVKLHLSFKALYKLLPPIAKRSIPMIEDEPDDLISERFVARKNGNGEKNYGFMLTRYEPDLLLTEVSRLFPRLCFTLGWVAQNIDEAASKFIQNGKIKRYSMPDKRRRQIHASKYKEWGEERNHGKKSWGQTSMS